MPFALLFVGMILIITGFQNTYAAFGTQVQKDFSGDNSFIYWVAALAVIGGVGYIKPLEPVSRAFMVLLVIVIFLQKGNANLFTNLVAQFKSGSTSAVNPIGASLPGGSTAGSDSGNSGGGFGDLITPSNILAVASFL